MEHVAEWVKHKLGIREVRTEEDMRRVVELIGDMSPSVPNDFGEFYAERHPGCFFDMFKRGKTTMRSARHAVGRDEHIANVLKKLLEGELRAEHVSRYLASLPKDARIPKSFRVKLSHLLLLLSHLGVISIEKEKSKNIYRLNKGKEEALEYLIRYLCGEEG